MLTNLMIVLSLEDDVPCAVTAPSKGYFITQVSSFWVMQYVLGTVHPVP